MTFPSTWVAQWKCLVVFWSSLRSFWSVCWRRLLCWCRTCHDSCSGCFLRCILSMFCADVIWRHLRTSCCVIPIYCCLVVHILLAVYLTCSKLSVIIVGLLCCHYWRTYHVEIWPVWCVVPTFEINIWYIYYIYYCHNMTSGLIIVFIAAVKTYTDRKHSL